MNTELQDCLKDVGHEAEIKIPDRSEYTSCFGFHSNWDSPVIKGRQDVLRIIYWLRTLANSTNDESILRAALYLADKYIQPHRATIGEIKLFEELDELKIHFNVHYHTEGVEKLKAFSKDHTHIPDIIRHYLISHENVLQITHWINELAQETKNEAIIQAAVYLADKYLKHHRTTVDEIELYRELEAYKSFHDIQYSKENIIALREFSKDKHHENIPSVIREYLEGHAVALEINHWLAELSTETKDKHVLHGAYYVANKYLKEHLDTIGNVELSEKLKHAKNQKYHLFHSRTKDMNALIVFSQHHDHITLPEIIADFLRDFAPESTQARLC